MKKELKDLIDDCNSDIKYIERKINYIKKSNLLDKEISYLTNYVLIRVSGTVELVYRSIIADYFSTKLSDNRIDRYLNSTIRNGSMSAEYDNMCNLLDKFDEKWSKEFKQKVEKKLNKEKIKSATHSLVRNRHLFAHGKTPSATFKDIKQYYEDILKLIEIFDSVVK